VSEGSVELDVLTAKDFASDQEVRWCPGCGDYSILAQVKKVLPTLGIPKEKYVFVSGIGCSSRFPYYVETYGMHSVHGRACAIATGVKLANPELSVWVATGDGDALSIGGNHFVHMLRKNIGLKVLMFNNRIYGLTKGQYSPTTELGKRTKTSPWGSVDRPFNALSVAIGAEATFVARALDSDPKQLCEVLERAARHEGTAFVEIYQNCVVFNDGAFAYSHKSQRAESMLYLEHGKPMIFGKEREKGIRLLGTHPEVVNVGKGGVAVDDLLVHDERAAEPTLAYFLSRMRQPEFPEPVGVFRCTEDKPYERLVYEQVDEAKRRLGDGDLAGLLHSGETWEVD
jgi:2-oxoglutarate ferredoxin oxidoreductase subunit beta